MTFVLFGKAFRRINKPNLVNSINDKHCLVEIEFETNGKEYLIRRGMKPNVFEIHCNSNLLNQDSKSRDYQADLEKFILKMNFKSFTQIVILGAAGFTPFMQLTPADRRIITEDFLDIKIFSVMNILVKQRLQVNKEEIEKNRVRIQVLKEKRQFIHKTLDNIKESNTAKIAEYETEIARLQAENASYEDQIRSIEEERDVLLSESVDLDKEVKKHADLLSIGKKIQFNIDAEKKQLAFYEHESNCPTCRQKIADGFKAEVVQEMNGKIDKYRDGLSELQEHVDAAVKVIVDLRAKRDKATSLNENIKSIRFYVQSNEKTIANTKKDMENLSSNDKVYLDSTEELAKVNAQILEADTERENLIDERQYIDVALNLLKDGGIKTKIIKQYIPVINKLINKYLTTMGFFVHFEINENFEETIKSRHCDTFSYYNFSEGEKMRIDLALLFTWRTIAKMRNSANTNILILDEIFDGSLDANGVDEFLKIMQGLSGDASVYVISHRSDMHQDKFDKVYKFEKSKSFSHLA